MKWTMGVLLAAVPISAAAQSLIAARAGLISHSEGEVYLDDKLVAVLPTSPPSMHVNARLRSGDGRAEVLLNPCVVLHLDSYSAFQLTSNRLADTRVELLAGSAIVQADGLRDAKLTLVLHGRELPLNHEGLFRVDFQVPRLKVFEGKVTVTEPNHVVEVGPGQTIALVGQVRAPERFDRNAIDSFDWWSKARIADYVRETGLRDRQERDRLANEAARKRLAQSTPLTRGRGYYDSYPLPSGIPSGRPRVCSSK